METIKGYKFIQNNMKSRNGDHEWEIGKWYKLDENKIELCEYGFHACLEPYECLGFIYGNNFFRVEARGKIIYDGVKFVSSEMRLVEKLQADKIFKIFAIWSAKQCLSNYEKKYPKDNIVRDCIKASGDYIDNKITLSELYAARNAISSIVKSTYSFSVVSAATRGASDPAPFDKSADVSAYYTAPSANFAAASAYYSSCLVPSNTFDYASSVYYSAASIAHDFDYYDSASYVAAYKNFTSAANKELNRLINKLQKC
jgi:hypothetical protein